MIDYKDSFLVVCLKFHIIHAFTRNIFFKSKTASTMFV